MSLQVLNIQALRTGWDGTNFSLNIGATATSRVTGASLCAISSDMAYCLNIGDTAATTDFMVPANVIIYAITNNKSLGCISATGGNGTLYISEAV